MERIHLIATIHRRKLIQMMEGEPVTVTLQTAGGGIRFEAFQDRMCKWCGSDFTVGSKTARGVFCSEPCQTANAQAKHTAKAAEYAATRRKRDREQGVKAAVQPHMGRTHSEHTIRKYLIQLPNADFTTREAAGLWQVGERYATRLVTEMEECGLVRRFQKRGLWIKTSRGAKG